VTVALKVGLMFANTVYSTPDDCHAAVAVAEELGVESLWAVEHVMTPVQLDSSYPYSDDGKVLGLNDAMLCDPVVWLSFMAGISTTLRLATGIMILPQRHPAYVAKEWATLDRLSGGRAMLGVGLGWMREEMEAVGVPFGERAARTDESITAIRSLWGCEPSTFEGQFFRWSQMVSMPKPVQPGGVPIIVGGHAPAAGRRAARLGDGLFWPGSLSRSIHAVGDDAMLREVLVAMRDECRLNGRNVDEIEVTVGANGATADVLHRLEDMGVKRVVVGSPSLGKLRSRLEPLLTMASAAR
jgi:probable F420-dependent oxidoreductase